MGVIAYHLIWTNYGTWLPNDPRGSGSRSVYTPAIAELGESHLGRRAVQPPRRAVREFYDAAEPQLEYPVIRFDQDAQEQIAESLGEVIRSRPYTCYACAVLPDHVHLVIRKHRDCSEEMIARLQEESANRLRSSVVVPPAHPVWTRGGWKVYLDSPRAVWSRIRYVENNPVKEGLPRQEWGFVVRYDDWPFHRGGAKPQA
jgi:REP element-mobilizing transposase RayT